MKVAEKKIYDALLGRKPLKQGKSPYMRGYRDDVVMTDTGYEVKLWGHTIAKLEHGVITLSDCGYATQTTASRINTVCYFEGLPVRYSWGKGGAWKDNQGNVMSCDSTIKWDNSKNVIMEA